MMLIDDLRKVWSEIDPISGGFLRIGNSFPLDFHLGYSDGSKKALAVLGLNRLDYVPSSKAISVLGIEKKNNNQLLFVLNDANLDELFVKLCWDLIQSTLLPGEPDSNLVKRYRQWLRLLEKPNPQSISKTVQKGLIGELLFLLELTKKMPLAEAIASWVGPEGADQDFVFSESWTEVKAVKIAAEKVEISSVQQLDCEEPGVLNVFFMDKTTSNSKKAVSLSGLIEKMLTLIADDEFLLNVFFCKIAKVGIIDPVKEKYDDKYIVKEERKYNVSPSFPKLTQNGLPEGIARAQYDIDLSVIEKYRLR